MIRVYYWPRELRLIVTGHASHRMQQYPDVCAAVSALFYSCCYASDGLRKRLWAKRHAHLDEKGIGYVRIWAKRRYFIRCRTAMGTCVGGMLALADQLPHLVHVEVCTGIPFNDEKALEEGPEGGVSFLQKFCYDMRKDRPLADGKPAADGQKGNENGKD